MEGDNNRTHLSANSSVVERHCYNVGKILKDAADESCSGAESQPARSACDKELLYSSRRTTALACVAAYQEAISLRSDALR